MPTPARAALLAVIGGTLVLAAGPAHAKRPGYQAVYKPDTRQFCLRDPGTWGPKTGTPPPECRSADEWQQQGLTVQLRPRAPVAIDAPAQP